MVPHDVNTLKKEWSILESIDINFGTKQYQWSLNGALGKDGPTSLSKTYTFVTHVSILHNILVDVIVFNITNGSGLEIYKTLFHIQMASKVNCVFS